MKRRGVVVGLCSSAFAWAPRRSIAQGEERMWRVGLLSPTPNAANPVRAALRDLGYVEGRNLATRMGVDANRLPALAREMVEAQVDVVVSIGLLATRAALAANAVIPVVFFGNFDPVAVGLVDNLARPGGRLTGILIAPDGTLAAKRVELLKASVPHAKRMGLLLPDDPTLRVQVGETSGAARAQGIELIEMIVRSGDYPAAFAALAAQRVEAVVVTPHTYFMRDRHTIIALATKHKLPAIYEWREQVVDGGLMAYGTSQAGQYARVASHVDRILKGTAPGELPIERPSQFGLVINLKAAKAIGLTIPQALLLRADEVIE